MTFLILVVVCCFSFVVVYNYLSFSFFLVNCDWCYDDVAKCYQRDYDGNCTLETECKNKELSSCDFKNCQDVTKLCVSVHPHVSHRSCVGNFEQVSCDYMFVFFDTASF